MNDRLYIKYMPRHFCRLVSAADARRLRSIIEISCHAEKLQYDEKRKTPAITQYFPQNISASMAGAHYRAAISPRPPPDTTPLIRRPHHYYDFEIEAR